VTRASHLHPKLRPLLDADLRTRVRAIKEDRWVSYPTATNALNILEELLDTPKKDRMPGLVIWGDTNNGKTSIVKRFARLNPPNDNPKGEAVHYPVLMLQLPEKPDLRSFYSDVLKKMHATYRSSNQIGNLRDQAISLLEDCDVRMIIIDELHNALLAGEKSREQIFVMIRYLINELRIPIVCSGLNTAVLALQTDQQLSNRFEAFHLPYWENGLEFRKLLHNYQKVLPLAEDSQLATSNLADIIFQKTNATVGEFIMLLEKSALFALRNGAEKIDEEAISNSGYIHPDLRRKAVEDENTQDIIRRRNESKSARSSQFYKDQ